MILGTLGNSDTVKHFVRKSAGALAFSVSRPVSQEMCIFLAGVWEAGIIFFIKATRLVDNGTVFSAIESRSCNCLVEDDSTKNWRGNYW